MDRLAAYLDEAGEDPQQAADTLLAYNLRHVALRYAWASNVCEIQDQSCQRLKDLLTRNDIKTTLVASDLGKVPIDALGSISQEQIRRTFDVVRYFGAPLVRVHAGISTGQISAVDTQQASADKYILDWMNRISDIAISDNVVPVLEVGFDSFLQHPSAIASVLASQRRWKLLYDPAQLIVRRHLDPFVKYWTLLKRSVAIIDLHDYKIGHGFKPVGFGDGKLDLTLRDAATANYHGWYILEPGLGRKHGNANTKAATFALAVEGLQHLLESIGLS